MARHRGNSNDHEPGGDPSWLGGKDRGLGGPTGAADGGGWSSDFSAGTTSGSPRPDPDFSVPQEPRDAETMAPRFGRITGDEAIPAEHEEQPQWRSEFESATGISGKRGRSLLSQLLGVLGSGVGLLIFAVIFFRFLDVTFWWAFLLIGYPLLSRGARALRKHLDE